MKRWLRLALVIACTSFSAASLGEFKKIVEEVVLNPGVLLSVLGLINSAKLIITPEMRALDHGVLRVCIILQHQLGDTADLGWIP
jgi:hypothetical protein